MTTSSLIAEILLSHHAVFLRPEDPFIWTSGMKSPVYCDNRLLISSVQARSLIINSFIELIKPLDVDLIAGCATAGIPWGAWIAQKLDLPFVYVRASEKSHGRQNAIEGKVTPHQKVILIEDLISTGKSSLEAAKKLQEKKLSIKKILSIFTYDFSKARELFHQHHLQCESLVTFDTLIEYAETVGQISSETREELLQWKASF